MCACVCVCVCVCVKLCEKVSQRSHPPSPLSPPPHLPLPRGAEGGGRELERDGDRGGRERVRGGAERGGPGAAAAEGEV